MNRSHPHNKILLSNKKEQTTDKCNTQMNLSGNKEHISILSDSIYTKLQERNISMLEECRPLAGLLGPGEGRT